MGERGNAPHRKYPPPPSGCWSPSPSPSPPLEDGREQHLERLQGVPLGAHRRRLSASCNRPPVTVTVHAAAAAAADPPGGVAVGVQQALWEVCQEGAHQAQRV